MRLMKLVALREWHESADKPFEQRRILPAYQELLDSGALKGGTDSTQLISEDRDDR